MRCTESLQLGVRTSSNLCMSHYQPTTSIQTGGAPPCDAVSFPPHPWGRRVSDCVYIPALGPLLLKLCLQSGEASRWGLPTSPGTGTDSGMQPSPQPRARADPLQPTWFGGLYRYNRNPVYQRQSLLSLQP